MSAHKHYLLILSTIFVTSCASITVTKSPDSFIKLTKNNFQELNGMYEIDKIYADKVFWNKRYNPTNVNNRSGYIEILMKSIAEVSVKYYQSNKLVASTIIKGELKNGHFISDKMFFKMPFPPIPIYGIGNNVLQLGINHKNKLTVDYVAHGFGMVVILPLFESVPVEWSKELKKIK